MRNRRSASGAIAPAAICVCVLAGGDAWAGFARPGGAVRADARRRQRIDAGEREPLVAAALRAAEAGSGPHRHRRRADDRRRSLRSRLGESRCHRQFHAAVAQSVRGRDRTHGGAHPLRREQSLFQLLQLRPHAGSDHRPQHAARRPALHIRLGDDLSRSRPDAAQRLQFRDRRVRRAQRSARAQQHRGIDRVGHDLAGARANRAGRLGGGVRHSLQEPLL